VRLAHDSHNGNSRSTPNRLGNQLGQDVFLVVLRHGSNNCNKWRQYRQVVLFRNLPPQGVQVDIFLHTSLLSLLEVLDQGVGNVGAGAHVAFILRCQFFELGCGHALAFAHVRVLGLRLGHSGGRHRGGKE
jgi:hypothetical protein